MMVTEPKPTGGGAALPTDVTVFLTELSGALDARPAAFVEPPPASLARRLQGLLRERPRLTLEVGRCEIAVAGAATDPQDATVRYLCRRLRRRGIDGITFARGVEADEIDRLLRLLALEEDRSGWTGGVDTLPHVRISGLSALGFELLGDTAQEDEAMASTRLAQRWRALAGAVLPAGSEDRDLTPARLATAIFRHVQDLSYEQAIASHLLVLAPELRDARAPGALAMRRRLSDLILAIRPEMLARLLEAMEDRTDRREFVLIMTETLAPDAVLEIAGAAATVAEQPLSRPVFEVLSKLAEGAEAGGVALRAQADAALREEVEELVAHGQSTPSEAAGPAPEAPEPERIVQMSLETESLGRALWSAVGRIDSEGRSRELFRMLRHAGAESRTGRAIADRVATPMRLPALLKENPVDFELVDRLAAQMGGQAASPLLDALADSPHRATRRGVFDRLVRMGRAAGPAVTARLKDQRWFVQRNLLNLLEEIGYWTDAVPLEPYANHPDARVRRAAIRLLARIPGKRDKAIVAALRHTDADLARLALAAATVDGVQRDEFPEAAIPVVLQRIKDPAFPEDLRLLALRFLRGASSAAALETLISFADGGRSLLGGVKLARKAPEMLVALAGLAIGWPEDKRARQYIEAARKSKDPEIQAAASPAASLGMLRELLRDDSLDLEAIDRMVEQMGLSAAAPLLDALVESPHRATRRATFDRLIRLGSRIGPLVVARLKDQRWFVQRNLLGLLDELDYWTDLVPLGPYANHPDWRVRRAAIKLMLKIPGQRDEALRLALLDAEIEIARVALVATTGKWTAEECPEVAVPVLVHRIEDPAFPADLRLLAIRLVKTSNSPAALDLMLSLVSAGTNVLGRPRLAAKSPEMLAGLEALASGWPRDPRVTAVLQAAFATGDPDMRTAATAEGRAS